jgi:hypothetical protein
MEGLWSAPHEPQMIFRGAALILRKAHAAAPQFSEASDDSACGCFARNRFKG